MSKKKKRKFRPEPPKYFAIDTDNCWRCKHQCGCSGCKFLKKYAVEHTSKRKERRISAEDAYD